MKIGIIDCEKKGNVVRFYLGDVTDEYYGDAWECSSYEHNASVVYQRFVKETVDVAFPFDCEVLEPVNDWRNHGNSNLSRNDLKERKMPCLIVVPPQKDDGYVHYYNDCFYDCVGMENVLKFYFGDELKVDCDTIKILKKGIQEIIL